MEIAIARDEERDLNKEISISVHSVGGPGDLFQLYLPRLHIKTHSITMLRALLLATLAFSYSESVSGMFYITITVSLKL